MSLSIVTILIRTIREGDVISQDLYVPIQGHLPCWKYEDSTNRSDVKRKREKKEKKKQKPFADNIERNRRRKKIYK